MISILDYGSGNLRSAQRAFELTGHSVTISSSSESFLNADAYVIPGVGAFGACMQQLISIGGDQLVREAIATGKPVFGICVGMQIFFSEGLEKGVHQGLGIFDGQVSEISAPVLPHIGWNSVEDSSPLFAGVEDQSFYFVHSYAAKISPSNSNSTWTTYGERFVSAVEKDNVFITQFHPEKSGDAGLQLIKNWAASI